MIDLTGLLCGSFEELNIDGEYVIPKEIFDNSNIIDLDKVVINNEKNIKDKENELNIIASVKGKMKINDSITLEEVWYPFEIQIDEKLNEFIEKNQKYLDILSFLWQNIVLEVPLRYTLVSDYSIYHGDGWKLVSEEELVNNPFKTLLNNEDRSD